MVEEGAAHETSRIRGPAPPREYLFPLALAVAFVVLGSAPYVYGYWTAPEGTEFMGFVGRGTPGANGYLMLARQVADGGHLMQNQYTPAPTPYTYFNLEWWLFGQCARVSGLSLMGVFHVWRVLTVLAYFAALYWFAGLCLPTRGMRRYAVLLVTIGTGFGWIVWGVNRFLGLDLPLPADLGGVCVPGYLVSKPHFMRAAVFALLKYGLLLRGEQTGKARYFALSGVAALGHSAIRPYHLPETYLVYALLPLLLCWKDGRLDLRRLGRYALAGLVLLPAVAYYAWMAWENTLGMAGWQRDSLFLLQLALWLGWPFVVLCVYFLLRGFAPERVRAAGVPALLLGLWLLIAWLLLNTSPYFSAGQELAFFALTTVPPIAVLLGPWREARGWLAGRAPGLAAWLEAPGRARLLAAALLLAAMPGTIYVYANFFRDLHRERPGSIWRYYLDDSVAGAVQWLGVQGHETAPVLLASPATAQFVPRLADVRVVCGHDMLSPYFAQERGYVERFYRDTADVGYKRWLAERCRVDYVLVGPEERALGAFDAPAIPWLEPVFTQDDVTLYAVHRSAY